MGRIRTGQGPGRAAWAVDAVALATVGACLWASCRASLGSRLWMDDLLTLSLAADPSLPHVFDAVWQGLDDTPPVYALLGWILHGLLPRGADIAAALRLANAAFLAGSFVLLDRIARRFLRPMLALACVCAFLALQRGYAGHLLVEVRTYALFFLCAVLCLHRSVADSDPASGGPSAATALCFLALTASHTFGIVDAGILACATSLAFALGRRWSDVGREVACLVPSAVAAASWLPVLRHQATIPSWMATPDLVDFAIALHPPHAPAAAAALTVATGLSLASLARSAEGGAREGIRRVLAGRAPEVALLAVLPAVTILAMAAVWCESRFAYPVFNARYFGFNALVTFAAVIACAAAAARALPGVAARGPVIAAAACAALCADLLLFPAPPNDAIACVDPETGSFVEDRFAEDLPVLAPFSTAWLPRVGVAGKTVLFPADGHLTAADRSHPEYENSQHYVPAFQKWAGLDGTRTDAELAALPEGFLVVDDGSSPWVRHATEGSDFALAPMFQGPGCRVWHATPARLRVR